MSSDSSKSVQTNQQPRKNVKFFSLRSLIRGALILSCLFVTAPFWVPFLDDVFYGSLPAQEVTVDRLLEQVRGEKYYWGLKGERWSARHSSARHSDLLGREVAIQKLSEYQPLPEHVRKDLISILLNGESDFDSGDGMKSHRSAICYTLGRAANHHDAYDAMIEVFRKRATSPELDDESHVKWFDKSWIHYGSYHTGPGPLMKALEFTPREHHASLEKKLESLSVEMRNAQVCSEWAVDELNRVLNFFRSEDPDKFKKREWEIDRFCKAPLW